MEVTKHKIRPAARLLRTVGQDLIKDVYAAIVELVKNSYDADSKDVIVKFSYLKSERKLAISVSDHGDGMSLDTVVNKWLVPATSDKLIRRRSSKNRILQGRKGIGRFAASVLGKALKLETVQNGYLTKLTMDMDQVETYDYLDEIELDVSTEETSKQNGTMILLETVGVTEMDVANIWTEKQLKKLLVELRSLTAPKEVYETAFQQGFNIEHDSFEIKLQFEEFPLEYYAHQTIDIEPFPLLELYDYRITGSVSASGEAKLAFYNQNIPSLKPEEINLSLPIDKISGQRYPGELFIDFRAYDRDAASIDNIIKRGLKDPYTGEFVSKNEARRVLDEYYGVGIYREQFKIRPYGDQAFDWLDLDKMRVQDPSRKIGHNQVIGFINIRHEEHSGLEEKSARDGLVENGNYFGLVAIIHNIIRQLEVRRFRYRDKAQKGRRTGTIDSELNQLFDFDKTKSDIATELDKLKSSPEKFNEVSNSITDILDKEQKKKAEIERKIRETIAVYQGQATLGKITHVLLHEGRKHIKYITETAPRVTKWIAQVIDVPDNELAEKIKDRNSKVVTHAKGLSFLFKKIEPLARTRRSPARKFNVEQQLCSVGAIFEADFSANHIKFNVNNSANSAEVTCNEVDFITVFSNLIENSIFWLTQLETIERSITINLFTEGTYLVIEYLDNGPGFQGDNLELMFEPGYSMKPDGTGLGLALAGEAMSRMGGKIEAKHSSSGAAFDIIFKGAI